jgi:hypothetical protein
MSAVLPLVRKKTKSESSVPHIFNADLLSLYIKSYINYLFLSIPCIHL